MAFNSSEFFNLQNQQGLGKPRMPGQPPLENKAAVDALGNSLLTQGDKNDINMVSSIFGGGATPAETPPAGSAGQTAGLPTDPTANPDEALATAALGPIGMLLG